MIYKDSNGFPVDQTMDGGDSAVRAGILALCNHPQKYGIDYNRYEVNFSGHFTRHPIQEPWNNPKN